MTAATPPVLLWLTDRSRYEDKIGYCKRRAFLRYHAGPHGYGWQRRQQRVPLATGSMVHQGIESILHWAKVHQGTLAADYAVPTAVQDTGVAEALATYDTLVDTRGLSYWEEGDVAMARLIAEQRLLIEGLVRAFALWALPGILADWTILHVEEEEVTVTACTCGIGDRIPPWTAHVEKGCEGIGHMTRADFLTQHKQSGTYAYHELKTASQAFADWRQSFETKIQPQLGTLGLEDRLGIEIDQIYVHGLLKGRRTKEYVAGRGYEGPEYQDSRLVTAWRHPGAPPAEPAQWAVRYGWTDEEGKARKLPKAFQRTSVAEYGDYLTYLTEFAEELRPQVLATVGPLPRKPHIRDGALRGWTAEEQRTREALWRQFDRLTEIPGADWSHPVLQAALDDDFPRSFQCVRFGQRHGCEMIPICHEHPGWEDPEGLLGFEPRRPHHTPELDQAVARGLLVPGSSVEEDE